jgi:hypothetical protein
MMPESTRRLFTMKGANPSIDTVMRLADALGRADVHAEEAVTAEARCA